MSRKNTKNLGKILGHRFLDFDDSQWSKPNWNNYCIKLGRIAWWGPRGRSQKLKFQKLLIFVVETDQVVLKNIDPIVSDSGRSPQADRIWHPVRLPASNIRWVRSSQSWKDIWNFSKIQWNPMDSDPSAPAWANICSPKLLCGIPCWSPKLNMYFFVKLFRPFNSLKSTQIFVSATFMIN